MSAYLGRVRAFLGRRPRTSLVVLVPACVVVGIAAGLAVGALTLR
ncbi:hypothetical protein KDY119_03039 [Luteimicrobium xylanilyticum]|uniref:Uncharacterized protein n=1 Tax=Luteimicrobium xylanilyticum TaxID=1133546 RepID=A0A5P9QDF3_9MICO|nr:hypothetical protein [Luteimicrobium xylanilyticum]QFU99508.1 hypothetical protein KDY119_03039 [Luteimicrobium xylanilyticum]